MPCQPRKARFLLKSGKAKVARMVPFTIQLFYGSSGYKQEVSLGIDAGTQHIGVSTTTENTVLFEAEVKPRTDIQELLASRRQLRRARRNRKIRYRKARFQNRKKPEGWLAPKYVQGFHLFDCVKYQDKVCFVFGRRSTGYFDLRTLDGEKVHVSASYKRLKRVQRASALLVEERRAVFPPTA